MTEHPLYLGLDLSPEYTQLSYYKLDEGVPESICHSDSKDTYLLPNIMFYTDKYKDGTGAKDESGWSVGAVAAGKRFKEDGVMVDRIYQKTIINEDTEIYGRKAICPTVGGMCWIYGYSKWVFDEDDPFPNGFTFGDIW